MRRGFSLIEAAIVLGVVGLVIGGIWVAAASVQKQFALKQLWGGVVMINENVRRIFQGQDITTYRRLETDTRVIPMIIAGAEGYAAMNDYVVDSYISAPLQSRQNVRLDNRFIVHDLHFLRVDDCIRGLTLMAASGRSDIFEFNVGPTRYTTMPFIPTAAECAVDNPVNIWFKF